MLWPVVFQPSSFSSSRAGRAQEPKLRVAALYHCIRPLLLAAELRELSLAAGTGNSVVVGHELAGTCLADMSGTLEDDTGCVELVVAGLVCAANKCDHLQDKWLAGGSG